MSNKSLLLENLLRKKVLKVFNILDQIRLIFFRYCCRPCTFIQYYKIHVEMNQNEKIGNFKI